MDFPNEPGQRSALQSPAAGAGIPGDRLRFFVVNIPPSNLFYDFRPTPYLDLPRQSR
jgi:hypothetical protein